ncbi:MAG: hypothetical protein GY696_17415, partial [Gammaproteobacteria bacterium]|nr:hypothetical protein [Gammaproteobacteria bacterium]
MAKASPATCSKRGCALVSKKNLPSLKCSLCKKSWHLECAGLSLEDWDGTPIAVKSLLTQGHICGDCVMDTNRRSTSTHAEPASIVDLSALNSSIEEVKASIDDLTLRLAISDS